MTLETVVEVSGSPIYKLQPRQYEALRQTPLVRKAGAPGPVHIGYGGAAGAGKAMPLREPVVTPYGYRAIGALEIGDKVVTWKGSWAKVIAIHPQPVQPIYKVTFSDGTWARVSGEHLWRYWSVGRLHRRHGERGTEHHIATTAQLRELLDEGRRLAIPVIQAPARLTSSHRWGVRPIPPYTLGVLIGDGCLAPKQSVTFTSADPEIAARVDAECGIENTTKKTNHAVYRLSVKLRDDLGRMGLLVGSPQKHIPHEYLWGPVDDRWDLLRGLMDTDGTVDREKGQASYCTVSERLANDVRQLVCSLGGVATISTKQPFYRNADGKRVDGLLAYTLYIKLPNNADAFHLSRKRDLAGCPQSLYRRISSIEPDGEEEARCITIDDPDGLYLTRDFIVTHNSYLSRAILTLTAFKWTGSTSIIFRRTRPELRDNHIVPFREEVSDMGGRLYAWNATDRVATWANGSRTLFGYLERDDDVYRYQGSAYDLMIFEEATHYSWFQVSWLTRNRLRSSVAGTTPFAVYPSNPGNIGHAWYKRLFIDRNFRPDLNEDPNDYAFVPARVTDNDVLLDRDPKYLARLNSLPEPLRSQLKDGDFEAGAGLALPDLRRDTHLIAAFPVPEHWQRFGSFDWGYQHPFVFSDFAVSEDGVVYLVDTVIGRHLKDREIIERIQDSTLAWERFKYTVAGHDCWNEIKARDTQPTTAERFSQAGLPLVRANTSRVSGLRNLREYVALVGENQEPRFKIMDTPANREVYSCLEGMVVDPDNMEDALKVDADEYGQGGDDPYDLVRYGLASRPITSKAAPPEPLPTENFDPGIDGMIERYQKRTTAKKGRGF